MNDEMRRSITPVLVDGDETRERARAIVERGGVVAFRTDTFYGLGANPFSRAAVSAVNELKGREGKPILVVVSDAQHADQLIAAKTKAFTRLAARFWAGALTLVAAAREGLPQELTAGTGTVGVRLPLDEDVRRFVRACGGALTATSANRAGEAPARTTVEVLRAFPTGLDLIVEGGKSRAAQPSTVVDVTGEEARLIREGAIQWGSIRDALSKNG
ncbi:MAG: L-threonylcarbamoyladenylate synthase [Acidobacteriota bacterium]|nr:L-threonylcarbamoyladenylate synthase [Acidobacteriota bacterium]